MIRKVDEGAVVRSGLDRKGKDMVKRSRRSLRRSSGRTSEYREIFAVFGEDADETERSGKSLSAR